MTVNPSDFEILIIVLTLPVGTQHSQIYRKFRQVKYDSAPLDIEVCVCMLQNCGTGSFSID